MKKNALVIDQLSPPHMKSHTAIHDMKTMQAVVKPLFAKTQPHDFSCGYRVVLAADDLHLYIRQHDLMKYTLPTSVTNMSDTMMVGMNRILHNTFPQFRCACHRTCFEPLHVAHLLEGDHILFLLAHLQNGRGEGYNLPWVTGPMSYDYWKSFQMKVFTGELQHERFGSKPDHNVKIALVNDAVVRNTPLPTESGADPANIPGTHWFLVASIKRP